MLIYADSAACCSVFCACKAWGTAKCHLPKIWFCLKIDENKVSFSPLGPPDFKTCPKITVLVKYIPWNIPKNGWYIPLFPKKPHSSQTLLVKYMIYPTISPSIPFNPHVLGCISSRQGNGPLLGEKTILVKSRQKTIDSLRVSAMQNSARDTLAVDKSVSYSKPSILGDTIGCKGDMMGIKSMIYMGI